MYVDKRIKKGLAFNRPVHSKIGKGNGTNGLGCNDRTIIAFSATWHHSPTRRREQSDPQPRVFWASIMSKFDGLALHQQHQEKGFSHQQSTKKLCTFPFFLFFSVGLRLEGKGCSWAVSLLSVLCRFPKFLINRS